MSALSVVSPAKHDEFSCCCCGAGLLEDGMCCPDCDAFGCGEQDHGAPCLVKEAERHAENERKAELYDAAVSDIRNALARFEELRAERKAAGDVYFPMPGDAPGFLAARDAYDTAAKRVYDEAFRVVGTVEAVVARGSR